MRRKIAIVAGNGNIPLKAIKACKQNNDEVFIIALKGITDKAILTEAPYIEIKLGQIGKAIKFCKSKGVTEAVMIGGLQRPSWAEIVPDFWTARKIAKHSLKIFGDNSLLTTLIKEAEKEGFKILAIQDILPELLMGEGLYTKHSPSETSMNDIKRGAYILSKMSELDIGQSIIMQQGMVIGLEAIEGTDNLIKRSKDLLRKGEGGILVKMKKKGQDKRVDLPTIGTTTIENAHKSGLIGIAVEAEGTLVVDLNNVVNKANELGLFVIGIANNERS